MWFARAFTDGVRAEAPPPDRPRTRTTTTPRAAPVATPAQARLSPRARIERGARRHVRLRACCMVSGWPAPRMHHAGPSPGRPSLARCLSQSQLVASCALSSAQLAGPWPGGVARACKHQSVAAPCHASFCFAPGPVVLQRSRVQRRQPWHGMCGRQRVVHSGVYLCVACQAACPSSRSSRGVVPPLPPCSATAICLSPQLPCGRAGWCMVTRAGRRNGRTRALLHAACSYSAVSVWWPYLLGRDFRCVGRWGRLRDAPACLRLRFFVPACL